jgi:MoxR-like ATPase
MPDSPAHPTGNGADTMAAVQQIGQAYEKIKNELAKVIVGQEQVIDELLIALFARGHALLVGVPGLAKTKLISSLAKTLSLSFSRIQFTPDLMPSDITGTEVIQENKATGAREFNYLPGPVFANIVLADEINRTPPKTQAALLESMQENQVTAGGKRRPLPLPFFVLATQNPIEQEGTYPLPEAQLDRFMFNIKVDYPSAEEELRIIQLTTSTAEPELGVCLHGDEIRALQELVRRVPVADHVAEYAMKFARMTRVGKEPDLPSYVKDYLAWGAGPRASQYLILGGKARAVLQGRHYVSGDDIRAVAHPVLRHRIITNFGAEAEGITSDHIIDRLIADIPRHQSDALADPRAPQVTAS